MSDFKVGDIVIWTNDYGVNWGEHEIVAVDKNSEGYFYIAPSDSPWVSTNQRGFKLSPNQTPIAPEGLAQAFLEDKNTNFSMVKVFERFGMYKQEIGKR